MRVAAHSLPFWKRAKVSLNEAEGASGLILLERATEAFRDRFDDTADGVTCDHHTGREFVVGFGYSY